MRLAVLILLVSPLFGQGIERARQHLEQQELDRAEAELLKILDREPRSAEALFLLGALHSQRGDHQKAETFFIQALQLEPRSIPLLNNLGVNALHRGDERKAEGYFRQVLSVAPGDRNAGFNLGLIELKRKRFPEAARLLRKAAAEGPPDLAVLQGLLEAEMALGSAAAVTATTGRITQLAPADPRFYFQLASPLVEKGYHDAALLAMERARALWPDSPDVAYNLAVIYFHSGKIEPARKLAEAALKKGDRADLHHLLGDIYEKLDRHDKAVEAYQSAVRLDPEQEDYYFALGYEFLLHHNFDLAEKIFTGAAARLPRALKPRLGLAAAHFARSKYGEAIEALRAAIDVAPTSDLGYAFLGRAFLLLSGQENLFGADWVGRAFEQYIKLRPQEAFPYFVRAVSLRADQAECLRLVTKALDLDPRLADAHLEAGRIYFDSGRYPEAIAALEKAAELNPDRLEAHYRLFRAYAKAGQSEKARRASDVFVKKQKEQQTQAVQREKEILRFLYTLK